MLLRWRPVGEAHLGPDSTVNFIPGRSAFSVTCSSGERLAFDASADRPAGGGGGSGRRTSAKSKDAAGADGAGGARGAARHLTMEQWCISLTEHAAIARHRGDMAAPLQRVVEEHAEVSRYEFHFYQW